MKIGYIIIAILLWSLLPIVLLLGWLKLMPAGLYGSVSGSYFCVAIPGVIAIIVGMIFFIKGIEKTPPKEGRTQINRAVRNCPNCRRAIRLDAKICPYCSKKI